MNLLLDAIADRVARRVAEQQTPTPSVQDARPTLDPLKPYTSEQAGDYLGLSANRVYEIPEAELPRVRHGGRSRILGINLMLYAMGQPPIDTEALAKSIRERFLDTHGDAPRPVRRVGPAAAAMTAPGTPISRRIR